MSHARYLRDLLRPLGIYDLEAPFCGGELDVQGLPLDVQQIGRASCRERVLYSV